MPNTCEIQLNYFLFHQSICLTFAMCDKKYKCINLYKYAKLKAIKPKATPHK